MNFYARVLEVLMNVFDLHSFVLRVCWQFSWLLREIGINILTSSKLTILIGFWKCKPQKIVHPWCRIFLILRIIILHSFIKELDHIMKKSSLMIFWRQIICLLLYIERIFVRIVKMMHFLMRSIFVYLVSTKFNKLDSKLYGHFINCFVKSWV